TRLEAALKLDAVEAAFESPWPDDARALFAPDNQVAVAAILAWGALEALGRAQDPAAAAASSVRLFETLRLRGVVAEAFGALGVSGEDRWRAAARVRLPLAHPQAASPTATPLPARAPLEWLNDPDAAWLVGVNEYDGHRY